MSLPRTRRGSDICFEPTERWTSWVAASSAATCKPLLPAPTTRTRPVGTCAGLVYSEVCTWKTVSARSAAKTGRAGNWNAPVATTTADASHGPPLVETRKRPSSGSTRSTLVEYVTGNADSVA